MQISRGTCNECISYYYLGEDLKCSKTNGGLEPNDGICIACSEGYYLGLDNKCSLIKRCIYSSTEYSCLECEDNYYYNVKKLNLHARWNWLSKLQDSRSLWWALLSLQKRFLY